MLPNGLDPKVLRDMKEYEGRFWARPNPDNPSGAWIGGAYGWARLSLRQAAPDAPIRQIIQHAHTRYNDLRALCGWEPVRDWTRPPARTARLLGTKSTDTP